MKYGKCAADWKGLTKDGSCKGCMMMVEEGKCPYSHIVEKEEAEGK